MHSCSANPSYGLFPSSAAPSNLPAIPAEKVKADAEQQGPRINNDFMSPYPG
jgi:hypothetical protein